MHFNAAIFPGFFWPIQVGQVIPLSHLWFEYKLVATLFDEEKSKLLKGEEIVAELGPAA